MKLDLEHQGTEPWESEVVLLESEAKEFFDELHLVDRLHGTFYVVPVGDESFSIQGEIEGTQLLNCSRTLEPFQHPVRISIQADVSRASGSKGQELDDEDEELYKIRIPVLQKSVDFSECVRQLVILQEPINPVKDPSGHFNWTDPAQNSQQENAVDPRWEKLKAWKPKA